MFNILQAFTNKAELRESKDEILVGEIVRHMGLQGHPAISFLANSDWQRVQFKTPRDELLNSVFVTLDRKTGGTALQEAILGSKATLHVTAEVKNRIADPDDLVKMYRTDFANLFKVPILGGIRLNHELNSVFATKMSVIDIGTYILKGEEGRAALATLLEGTVAELKQALLPYKK